MGALICDRIFRALLRTAKTVATGLFFCGQRAALAGALRCVVNGLIICVTMSFGGVCLFCCIFFDEGIVGTKRIVLLCLV